MMTNRASSTSQQLHSHAVCTLTRILFSFCLYVSVCLRENTKKNYWSEIDITAINW